MSENKKKLINLNGGWINDIHNALRYLNLDKVDTNDVAADLWNLCIESCDVFDREKFTKSLLNILDTINTSGYIRGYDTCTGDINEYN